VFGGARRLRGQTCCNSEYRRRAGSSVLDIEKLITEKHGKPVRMPTLFAMNKASLEALAVKVSEWLGEVKLE
jgi:hypothetical protein